MRQSKFKNPSALAWGLALTLAISSGCTPTCEQVCRKARECEITDRLSQDECVGGCIAQREMYDGWDDEEEKLAAFDDHRTCVSDATCEDLDAGVCYDEELFSF